MRSRGTGRLRPNAEVTLEANPTSVEASRFRGFRAAGVNRVSLGVQALDDAALKQLGRQHSAHEALAAVAVARAIFDRYSFDLIYARPGQTPEAWAAELKRALAQAGEHLSLYQLTIEQDTAFALLHAAGKLVVPDEDLGRALYDTTQAVCADAGLPAYEISNHARPGAECRHNLVYWRAHEYAGIGPGAHGRLDIGPERRATATAKRPETWLMRAELLGHGVETDEPLTRGADGGRVFADGPAAGRRHRPRALRAARRPPAQSATRRAAARAGRGRDHGGRHAAGDARRLSRARRRGRRSRGVTPPTKLESAIQVPARVANRNAVPGPAKSFGGALMIWPPVGDTFITASPRWLVPSGRKRNSPSMPVKPEPVVSTLSEKRC